MNSLQELLKLDLDSVLISVFVILSGIKAVLSLLEWLMQKSGLETKWMRNKRKEHELLMQTSHELSRLQERHDASVKQSIRHDELIKADILSLANTVNGIADMLKEMQEKENETKIKELKDSLIRYYNKYKDLGEWSKLEKDAFWDLFDDYEKRGGDGYIHTIVEPVMRTLNETD